MKKFFCVSGAAVLFWLLGGCSFEKTQQVQSVDTAMGTVVQQSIYTREADSGAARDILELTKKDPALLEHKALQNLKEDDNPVLIIVTMKK